MKNRIFLSFLIMFTSLTFVRLTTLEPMSGDNTNLIESIAAIFKSLKMNPSNVKVRNYEFGPLAELSTYRITHSVRYTSVSSRYIECIVYEYIDDQSAVNALDLFSKSEHLETMFKSFNFLFRSKNSLVLVRTGCNQRPESWEEVIKMIGEQKLIADKYIKCTCGGNCEVE